MVKGRMNRTVVVLITAVLAFGGSAFGIKALQGRDPSASLLPPAQRATAQLPCRRIVSLAPSITETLFALGLGEWVAAVTRYCQFPAEARQKAKIGGFYDVNYEALVALAPDLVILLPEQEKVKRFLDQAGFPVLVVSNKTIADIFTTIHVIARRCNVEDRSEALAAVLSKQMERTRQAASPLSHPQRVMVSIGGNMGSGPSSKICLAGPGTFYGQLVALAGGADAYQGTMSFPEISREGLIELNPDVIIDIAVNTDYALLGEETRRNMFRKWLEAASGTEAARNGRIHILEADYMVIPGPRFIHALEDVAVAIQSGKRQP